VGFLDQMESPDDGKEHILRSEARRAAVIALEDACEKVETPLQRCEHTLLPWVRLIIMPISRWLMLASRSRLAQRPQPALSRSASCLASW